MTIFSKSEKQPKEIALSFPIQFLVVFPERETRKKETRENGKKMSELPLHFRYHNKKRNSTPGLKVFKSQILNEFREIVCRNFRMFWLNGKHTAISVVSNSYFSNTVYVIDLIVNLLSLSWIQFMTYVLTKNTGLFH